MFKNSTKRLRALIIATAAFAIAGSGIAYAYWSSQGAGADVATTSETATTNFTVVLGTQVGVLTPGGSVTVPVTITNPGTTDLRVSNLAVAKETLEGTQMADITNCLASDYTVTVALDEGAKTLAKDASTTGTVTVTLANSALNQDGCKTQSVPLHVSAS